MTNEITKQDAAVTLSDEIGEMKILCNRVDCLLDEICNRFFYIYEYRDPKAHAKEITWNFDRYATLGDIAYDYSSKLLSKLKALDELSSAPLKKGGDAE